MTLEQIAEFNRRERKAILSSQPPFSLRKAIKRTIQDFEGRPATLEEVEKQLALYQSPEKAESPCESIPAG